MRFVAEKTDGGLPPVVKHQRYFAALATAA